MELRCLHFFYKTIAKHPAYYLLLSGKLHGHIAVLLRRRRLGNANAVKLRFRLQYSNCTIPSLWNFQVQLVDHFYIFVILCLACAVFFGHL